MKGTVARIALQGATSAFDKLYTYIIPPELLAEAKEGCRVLIPFSRGNIKRQGMIFEIAEDELKGLKSIYSLIDRTPILNEEMLAVCKLLHDTTFCTYYDAVHAVLPTGLTCRLVNYYSANCEFADVSLLSHDEAQIFTYLSNAGEKSEEDIKKIFGIVTELLDLMTEKQALIKNSDAKRKINDATQKWVRIADENYVENTKFTPRQREVINLLTQVSAASVKEICYFTGVSAAVIDGLVRKSVLIAFEKTVYRKPYKTNSAPKPKEIVLTDEQQAAFEGLYANYKAEKPNVSLLYGVTGSGKTQVFLKMVDSVIKDDKGVIVMVPEISLTPQLLKIFSDRYGDKIAVFVGEVYSKAVELMLHSEGKRGQVCAAVHRLLAQLFRAAHPVGKGFAGLGLVHAPQTGDMGVGLEAREGLRAYAAGGRIGHDNAGLRLQLFQLLIERVPFRVGHYGF